VIIAWLGLWLAVSQCYRTWEAARWECLSNHHHSTVEEYQKCSEADQRRYFECRGSQ
jgi:hypothetical protein